jgi:hypothetical protein
MPATLPQPRAADAPSALQVLVERFRTVPDYRCGNANQIHLLVDVFVTSIGAVLGSANSWLSVGSRQLYGESQRVGRVVEGSGSRSFPPVKAKGWLRGFGSLAQLIPGLFDWGRPLGAGENRRRLCPFGFGAARSDDRHGASRLGPLD